MAETKEVKAEAIVKPAPKQKIKASDLPTLDFLKQEMARRRYVSYVEYVHEKRWLPSKHLIYVCNTVQEFIEDKMDEKILILQLPPQHGKSQSVTETLPSWFLGKFPTKKVICASYGDDLATRFGRRNKEKIERFGKKLFGIEISKKVSASTEFELSNNVGGMISRGIMAGITGQAADLILCDDPIKNRQEADLASYRDRVWEEWLNSLKTRLSADGKVIIIMTRWHEDDLAGRVIKDEKSNVRVINLPCEAEENDPLGREIGDALFPEIGKGKKWLTKFKLSYTTAEGARAWSALFQGRPSSQEGNMLKRHWWKFYSDVPKNLEHQLQSWDCTFKDSDGTDFVVGQVWGIRGADIFLLDQVKDRMDFTRTMSSIEALSAKWPETGTKLIEDKANGPAVISMLRHKIGGLIAVNPKGSKVARTSAISPLIEAGNVYLPNASIAPWVNDFIEECAAFPNGAHDDSVDAMSQGLQRFIYSIIPILEKHDNREYPDENFTDYDDDAESFFD